MMGVAVRSCVVSHAFSRFYSPLLLCHRITRALMFSRQSNVQLLSSSVDTFSVGEQNLPTSFWKEEITNDRRRSTGEQLNFNLRYSSSCTRNDGTEMYAAIEKEYEDDGGPIGLYSHEKTDCEETSSSAPSSSEKLENGLYLVATPIGNLEDITLRALRVLKSVDLILAEDTRHSAKILQHYKIQSPMMSYHKFNAAARQNTLLQRLGSGQSLALITDAGMPGISDPGSELVMACIKANIRVYPIPGPSALITAIVASGLETSVFTFVGFLPSQERLRKKRLMAAASELATQVFFVPPHKLCSVVESFIPIFGPTRSGIGVDLKKSLFKEILILKFFSYILLHCSVTFSSSSLLIKLFSSDCCLVSVGIID